MALEIFWGSGSGPAWRVLLALAVKGVPFESHLLSFSKREHKSPEMLAMNPRGKVPVLKDGAFTLYESLAMLVYIDRKHPAPPLFGKTPEEAGMIERVIMEHESYGWPAITAFTRPLLFGKLDEQRDKVIEALPLLREELGRLESGLRPPAWLAGTALSAADLVVFPAWKTLERALGKPGADTLDHGLRPLDGPYPKLSAWAKRIEALPGYDATYPPHWREG
jgi:glutathione S-transferase